VRLSTAAAAFAQRHFFRRYASPLFGMCNRGCGGGSMNGGHPDEVAELGKRLKEINDEYRVLVRSGPDTSRLPRMAELRTRRLELMTRIVNIEQSGRPALCAN
jgi:hypothetical protein